MLVVTHEMQFAREVGDRVVFMDEGQDRRGGRSPRDVLDSPQEERTQRFLRRTLQLAHSLEELHHRRGRRSRMKTILLVDDRGHRSSRCVVAALGRRSVRRRGRRRHAAAADRRRCRRCRPRSRQRKRLEHRASSATRRRSATSTSQGQNAGFDVEIATLVLALRVRQVEPRHVHLRHDAGPRAGAHDRARRHGHRDVHVHRRPRHADRLLAGVLQGDGSPARAEQLADPARSPTSPARRSRRRAARSTTAG